MAGSSDSAAKRRGPGRPFVKGQSGNPSGRAKVAEEFRQRARRAVDEHVLSAWVAEVESQGEHWVRCSEMLAAYGYGRPASAPEDLAAAVAGPSPLVALSRAELLAIARGEPVGE